MQNGLGVTRLTLEKQKGRPFTGAAFFASGRCFEKLGCADEYALASHMEREA
jgi:hypothetical protein